MLFVACRRTKEAQALTVLRLDAQIPSGTTSFAFAPAASRPALRLQTSDMPCFLRVRSAGSGGGTAVVWSAAPLDVQWGLEVIVSSRDCGGRAVGSFSFDKTHVLASDSEDRT